MKKTLSLAALFLVAMTGNALADADYSAAIKAPSATVGKEAVATIRIQPKGNFHINQGFPTKLVLQKLDGVKLAKEKITKDDAAKFTEKEAEFKVAFTPESAGKKSFTGVLKFAVCQEETACVPKTEAISFTVDVK